MHMWIKRDIEPRLQRSARTRPVIVLTGARQAGKTSTLLRLFPKHGSSPLIFQLKPNRPKKSRETFFAGTRRP